MFTHDCSIPRCAFMLAYLAVPVRFLSSLYGICCLVLLSRNFFAKPKSMMYSYRNTKNLKKIINLLNTTNYWQIREQGARKVKKEKRKGKKNGQKVNVFKCFFMFTLLQHLLVPIRKLSGLISRWMKFLLWKYSMRPIIWKERFQQRWQNVCKHNVEQITQ